MVEVTVDLQGTLLEMEGAIREASNPVGRCVTEEALRRFDTDGSPIRLGVTKLTARGRDPKDYPESVWGRARGALRLPELARRADLLPAGAPGADHPRGPRHASPASSAPSTRSSARGRCGRILSKTTTVKWPHLTFRTSPIGSGVTEAACRTLVEQRLCASGIRRKTKGAKIILGLRSLVHITGRWAQCWEKVDRFGAECC